MRPWLLALAARLALARAQQDPINNFCRRFGHQTAVVDDRLYIDGGLVSYGTAAGNYSNTWLLWQDLTTTSDAGMPVLHANLSKNSTVPQVSGGALWADDVNKFVYLFGGEYAAPAPAPAQRALYAYDVINDWWLALGAPPTTYVAPVAYGAGVSVPARGEGYYYGGWRSNASDGAWTGARRASASLVRYDMDAQAWTSVAGPDETRRAEGSLVFLPAGDGGLLVYLGGVQDLHGNETATPQSLDAVFVYDVLSSKWYRQATSGAVPGDRRRFCAGAAWAADRSSYNIYVYGGAGFGVHEAGYDDLYVLTLPAFEWVRLYPDIDTDSDDPDATGPYPHHSMACNVVRNAQMLITGGSFPLTDACDVPPQWGTHNADLTGAFGGSAALWKLYAPNETAYQVPPQVVRVVGGSPAGHATRTAPAAGWASPDLPVLLTRTATMPVRTATRDVGDSGDSGRPHALAAGAIAGIAIGAVAALGVLAAGVWLCLRRRKTVRGSCPAPTGPAHLPFSAYGPAQGPAPAFAQAYPAMPGQPSYSYPAARLGYADIAAPPPVELAASNAAGYHPLTPLTPTSPGTPHAHALAHALALAGAKTPGGGAPDHASPMPTPTSPGSARGVPELSADHDREPRHTSPPQAHKTYYHP